MAYAAYLRVYEPVSAFHEPDRSRHGAARDECEFAVAMCMRVRKRWRAFAESEQAN